MQAAINKIQQLIVQTKSNVSHLSFDAVLRQREWIEGEKPHLGDTIQLNVSWHIREALGTLDNILRMEYFLFMSK